MNKCDVKECLQLMAGKMRQERMRANEFESITRRLFEFVYELELSGDRAEERTTLQQRASRCSWSKPAPPKGVE